MVQQIIWLEETTNQRAPPANGEPTERVSIANKDRVKPTRDNDEDSETYIKMHEVVAAKIVEETTYLEEVFSKKFEAVHALIKRLTIFVPPNRRSATNSYVNKRS